MMRQGIATIRENELTGGPPREQNVTSLPTARTEEEWVNSFEFPPTMEEIQGIWQPYSLKHEGAPYESGYDTKREAFWERMRSAPTLEGWDTEEERARYLGAPSGIETLGTMEDAPMIPNGGIQGALPEAIEMLEAAGRNGDVRIVHTEDGDTVVPKEVFEGPGGQQIRESLFRQMAQLGVDPERYVVGGGLNSINPETGLPEFFFKKAFEGIKKIFKKAAPIILPIILTPFIGPIAAGAVGAGIGTLIQGGDAKDALKAAAFGGISAGIMSGVSGMMSGAGGQGAGMSWSNFQAGIGQGLPAQFGGQNIIPFTGGKTALWGAEPGGETIFGNLDMSQTQSGGGLRNPVTGKMDYLMAAQPAKAVSSVPAGQAPITAEQALIKKAYSSAGVLQRPGDPGSLNRILQAGDYSMPQRPAYPSVAKQEAALEALLGKTPKSTTLGSEALSKVYDPLMEGIFGAPSEVSAHNIRSVAARARLDALNLADGTNEMWTPQQKVMLALKEGDAAVAKQQPGLIRQSLPLLAGSYALASLEDEERPPESTFSDPIDPRRVREARLFNEDATFDEIRFAERPPTTFQQIDPGFARFQPNLIRSSSTAFGAHGGEMQNFPPRIGAIAGPGTEKSDDVPAMLSDGEFVMTAQAVRGAGNGSRRQGVKNLYDIMRNFEAVA